jgi:hypothetical protein
MIANLKLGARLGLGFGLVLALLAGITALGIDSLNTLHQGTQRIVKDRYPQVLLARACYALYQPPRSPGKGLHARRADAS